MFAFSYLFYITVFFSLANMPTNSPLLKGVLSRFFIQANVFVFLWLGIGFAYVQKLASEIFKIYNQLIFYIIAFCLIFIQYSAHVKEGNQQNNYFFSDYGHSILDPLPLNSIILFQGDLIGNTIMYLHLCENIRPDLKIISLNLMTYDWFEKQQAPVYYPVIFPGRVYHPYKKHAYNIKQFLESNINSFPIFIAGQFKEGDESYYDEFTTIPFGMVQQIFKLNNYTFDIQFWINQIDSTLPKFKIPESNFFSSDSWEKVIIDDYYYSYHMKALTLLNFARKNNQHNQSLQMSKQIYQKIEKEHPFLPSFIYLNLGLVFDGLRKYDSSLVDIMILYFEKYLDIASTKDDSFQQVKTVVENYHQHKNSKSRK
jgi:hypothetical protein